MNPGTIVAWVVAFVLLAVVITGFARRVGWSAPVLLVVVGAAISFIPGVPDVRIEPEFVLYGVVPPLLFAAAFGTYVIDVRARRDTIVLLSVGLVVFTAFTVGWVTYLLLPAIGFAAAFAFAAVVAPTDASAVTAIAGRLKLPHRVVTVLEGESLLNDATALVLLNTAIAAIISTTSPALIAADLGLAIVGGVGIGLAIGWLVSSIRSRLRSPVLDTSLALITPYFAFIAADAVHGSGVLAVVISALYLGFRSPMVQSAEARVAEAVNWRTVGFLVENAVFLFIGLNAAGIVRGALHQLNGVWAAVGVCAIVIAALFLSRSVFVFLMVAVFRHGSRYMRAQDLRWKYAAVVSAANVRGVVTLAAIFLLPPETPGRELLQLMAFVVVVVSLLSGILLPRLIRRLRLTPADETEEFAEWEKLMAQAHASGLSRLESEATDADHERVLNQLRSNATLISDSLEHESDAGGESYLLAYRRLRKLMIRAERQYVNDARRRRLFPETVVAAALRAIDIEELAIWAAPVLEDTESSPHLDRTDAAPSGRARWRRRRGDARRDPQ
ncbi:cation:proton antiporter [Herbiconiux daphne]|uniref:Sodium:proton antiporter n=1 Tax=Herbiconiux daphne TaxID=2970914 RepID=A0ABT2H7G9_9MICO|nr:sodium:proton antiporter [Herbiconiux daphne]MCS5735900.1 sodium:proton antiporter [Herbiconiux daphne]